MELLEPLGQVTPAVLLMWLVVIGLALSTALVGFRRSTWVQRQRRDQRDLLASLPLQAMLHTLGIGSGRYLRNTGAAQLKAHARRCRHCPNPAICDAFFAGTGELSPETFCPNFDQLVKFTGRQAPTGGRSDD